MEAKFKVGDQVNYIGNLWSIPKDEVGVIADSYRTGWVVEFGNYGWILNEEEIKLNKEHKVLQILRQYEDFKRHSNSDRSS